MDPQLSAALVAALASLAVAILAWLSGRRQAQESNEVQQELVRKQADLTRELEDYKGELARQVRVEERALTAKAELDRVREPLLLAAVDLAHRIDNIRNNSFLAYLPSSEPSRRDVAVRGTLYRFARYWCVVESLYDRADLGKLLTDTDTQPVAATLRDIGRTFASDRYDSAKLMVWREEQRAIAELMRGTDGHAGYIGFATFFDRYEQTFATWFEFISRDLPTAATSERLRLVQRQLGELVAQLAPVGQEFYIEQVKKIEQGAKAP